MRDVWQFWGLTRRDLITSAIVFIAYFATAKLGLYIFFSLHTSPALIWPPVGIALAAMWFFGYRMWVPIFLAQFAAMLTMNPSAIVVSAIVSAAYALQAAVGLYFLRYFRFDPAVSVLRSAIVLVAASFVVTTVEPTIVTAWQYFSDALTISPLLQWGRAWAGGIFSVLVYTPFITTWFHKTQYSYARSEKFEIAAALATLTGVTYLIFATNYPIYFGISVIFFVPAVLIWFALRMNPRWLTLAVVLCSTLGIASSILIQPTATPLSVQLLADEVYLGLVAAIFLIFVAIVEERRSAYTALQENNARLDAALEKIRAEDKAKSDFIAILAHELRNPLAPIMSAHEWMQLEPQTPSSLEALASAQENTRMIQRLLDDLLDTARVARQKLELRKETIVVQNIVSKAVESSASFLQSRGHRLKITMPQEQIYSCVDPIRLKQIVINLLNNAGKYTEPEGNIELSIQTRDGWLMLEVKDTGVGISHNLLQTIFEPFNSVRTSNSAVGTGLGVGLSLTRRLVEMHGGTIVAESEGKGRGSTFKVRIPITQAPANSSASGHTFVATDRMRILIVDDNKDAARGLQKLLSHHGHTVEIAYSGEEGIRAASRFCPDIALLDIGLPDIDGYQVAHKMRECGINSLIAITGYGQESDRVKTREAGFVEHLIKPVGIDDVINVLGAIRNSPTRA